MMELKMYVKKKRHELGKEMRPAHHIEANKKATHDFNMVMEWLLSPDIETWEMLEFYQKKPWWKIPEKA